jgi:hypothetical protein
MDMDLSDKISIALNVYSICKQTQVQDWIQYSRMLNKTNIK